MLIQLLLGWFGSATAQQPCFLKCKDNYMHGMQTTMGDASAEWSVDMVTPLQALLQGDNKRGRLEKKFDRVCRHNMNYNRCLSFCNDNPARRILLAGQRAWNIICDDFRNDTEFRGVVVPCWADHGEFATQKCAIQAQLLQTEVVQLMEGGIGLIEQSIGNVCKSVHDYDKCFVWENYDVCGINAGKFLIKLTHQTSHGLVDLLNSVLGVQTLPKACKDWLNQKEMTSFGRTRSAQRRLRNSVSLMKTPILLFLCSFIL